MNLTTTMLLINSPPSSRDAEEKWGHKGFIKRFTLKEKKEEKAINNHVMFYNTNYVNVVVKVSQVSCIRT